MSDSNPTFILYVKKLNKTLHTNLPKDMLLNLNFFDLFLFFSLLIFLTSFFFSLIPKSLSLFSTNKTTTNKTSSTYGPPSYPIIGCLISFSKNRKRLLDWYTELLSASPTQTIVVRRLGARKVIVTANPDNVEYVLKTNFPNFPKGKPLADILGDLLGHGIFNVDGELWANQRKLASHEFTTKSLREFVVKTLEEEVENRLIPLLHKAAQDDQIIDLQEVLKRLTYDSICKVSLGTDPNCLDLSIPIPPLITAFDNAATISAIRATNPIYLIWKLKRALNIGSEKQLKHSISILHDLVGSIISTKQQSLAKSKDGENQDLLSRFLSAGYDGELARDMVISFIMAGRDTTAAAMTWLFWLLYSEDPCVRENIRSEMASAEESESGSLGYEAVKKNMKYLHACLCEAMRLYPPVAWDSKHAANDDVLPDGTKVRKGDRVTYFPYGMGRMKVIWGNDPLKFNPDRWFENQVADQQFSSDKESRNYNTRKLKMASPFEYPTFQAGPRVCLGKEMAFIQMKYVMASILSRFDFELVSSKPPIFVPLLTAHMAGGLRVRVKEIADK